jgi:beta-mannanase
MKIDKQLNKRHLYLLIFATVLLFLLIYTRGYQSLQGLLWGINHGRIGYLFDQGFCRIKGTENCLINFDELSVNFGVYDPNSRMEKNIFIALDHYFLNWNDIEFISNLKSFFIESQNKNRWIMLTVEPWHDHKFTDKNLMKDIYEGKYDHNIKRICSEIKKSLSPVFLRWGHEMENVTGRYPWATENHQDFIKAYNHFVKTCKDITDNIYFVWSPVGNSNLSLYWPEEKYVDYIGLSLFVYPDYEKRNYGYIRNFEQIFREKYERVKKLKKPIIIAELGITGDDKFISIWWYNALKNICKFKELRTIAYFNSKDSPEAWNDYDTPNWTLKEKIFPVAY